MAPVSGFETNLRAVRTLLLRTSSKETRRLVVWMILRGKYERENMSFAKLLRDGKIERGQHAVDKGIGAAGVLRIC